MRLIADGVVDREGVTGLAEPARLQRPPPRPPARRRARCRTARARPRPAGAGRPGPHRDHRPPLRRGGVRVRLREPAPVQRHGARRVRDHPDRAPAGPQGRRDRCRRAGRDHAPAGPARAVRRRRPARVPRLPHGARRRGGRRQHLRAHPRPARRTGHDAPHRRRPPTSRRRSACTTCATSSRRSPAARRLLDLDADPAAVDEHLEQDPDLGPLVRKTPGRRVPGAVAGHELAVRAVIGQQVSVAGARTVAGRLARSLGRTAAASPSAA